MINYVNNSCNEQLINIIDNNKDNKGKIPAYGLIDKLKLKTNLHICNKYKTEYNRRGVHSFNYKYEVNGELFETVITYKEYKGYNNKDKITLTVNPSHFPSYSTFVQSLIDIFDSQNIMQAKVITIDCTVDIYKDFDDEIKGIDFGKKRVNRSHYYKCKQTGIYAAKNPNKDKCSILVYDKSKQKKINIPITRYEKTLNLKEISLAELPQYVLSNRNIFDDIKRFHIKFIEPNNNTPKALKLFTRFMTKVEDKGFWLTKKELNKDRNFYRVYSKYFVLTPANENLNEVFQKTIINYF